MVEEGDYINMDDGHYNAARYTCTNDIQHLRTNELFRIRTVGDESNVLHIAAQYGNLEFIETVLNAFPDHRFHLLCKQNSKGETPLHLAAESGNDAVVQHLLNAHNNDGVPPEEMRSCWLEVDRRGDTPLHRALRYGHDGIAILLLERDQRVVSVSNYASESLAYLAAENFCQVFLRNILANNDDHNVVSLSGPFGQTIFHPARRLSGEVIGEILRRCGDDCPHLRVQDNDGKTALHYAVEENRESVVEQLLENDSSLALMQSADGLTPLHRAASMGSSRMIRIILELSPQSLFIRTSDQLNGQTALHVAKMKPTSLNKLLRNTRMKELINVADNNGNTPLHLALINSNLNIAYALLRFNGINWRLRNNEGRSPMDLCRLDYKIPPHMV